MIPDLQGVELELELQSSIFWNALRVYSLVLDAPPLYGRYELICHRVLSIVCVRRRHVAGVVVYDAGVTDGENDGGGGVGGVGVGVGGVECDEGTVVVFEPICSATSLPQDQISYPRSHSLILQRFVMMFRDSFELNNLS